MTKMKETYSDAKERFPEIKDIQQDLASLKGNVVGLSKHVQENGADFTAELRQKVRNRMEKLQSTSTKQLHKMEDHVKDKPAKSLAIAFVGGLVASWLFSGRK